MSVKLSTFSKITMISTVSLILASCLNNSTNKEELGTGMSTSPAKCLLQVKGKTYIDGTCKYSADADGSFRLFGKEYFTYVNVFNKNKAGASWNADPKSTHAQAPLGDVTRDGACWVNSTTKICAWGMEGTNPTRINFATGETSATVTGTLTGFEGEQNYVLTVRKGQTMKVEQTNKDNYVTTLVTAPNGESANDMDLSCNNKATVSPTMAGDYTINVTECKKADPFNGNFNLKITVK